MSNHRGFVMASLLITTTFVMMIGAIITQLVISNYNLAAAERGKVMAQFAADSGIDYAIAKLNEDNAWIGTAGELELVNNGNDKSTYEANISAGASASFKVIEVTGRYYFPANSPSPTVERKYDVNIRGIGPLDLGLFSVVTGVGGLIMENSSKIVAGDVFVNGNITMSGSSQIGLSNAGVNVRVAHQSCPNPPDATYPVVCGIGNDEPVTISSPAQIYGEVQARNQTDGDRMSNPGLVAGAPDPEPLPAHDRDAQKTAATNLLNNNDATCKSNNDATRFRTIPANTKIDGGDVEWKLKCVITIEGDVWITGNLSMDNTAQIVVADSLDTNMPTIMVDGATGVDLRNSSRFTANSLGTGLRLITYHSTATCSPDCTNVSGPDLFNSRDVVTIRMNQSFEAPESILYSRWSQLLIENSGDIGAILGQTVRLQNTTTITFGTNVLGGGGSTIPKTWLIQTYKRVYN